MTYSDSCKKWTYIRESVSRTYMQIFFVRNTPILSFFVKNETVIFKKEDVRERIHSTHVQAIIRREPGCSARPYDTFRRFFALNGRNDRGRS